MLADQECQRPFEHTHPMQAFGFRLHRVETVDNIEKKSALQMQCRDQNVLQKISKPLLNQDFFVTHPKNGSSKSWVSGN